MDSVSKLFEDETLLPEVCLSAYRPDLIQNVRFSYSNEEVLPQSLS